MKDELTWSRERVELCKELLCTSASYREGLSAIGEYLKRAVTSSALRNAFARYGHEAPASYVGTAVTAKTQAMAAGAAVADLDYGDEGTEPGERGTASAVGGVPVTGPRVEVVRDEADVPTADRTYIDRGDDEPRYEFAPLDAGSRSVERVLIVPDTHAPYHDKRAWAAMLGYAKAFRPDTIVHLGDFIDCFTVSDHDRDPRRGSQLEPEIEATKELRAELDALGAQRKIIALGNHSYRLERYCMRHAPALISMLRIENLLKFPENGWSVVPYMSHGKLGRLHFTHEAGHCGVHAVHQTGQAFASSVVFGHTHRLGASYWGEATGKRHVAASLGWLGSLREARYISDVKKRFWTHGFGTALVERSGDFRLDLVPIVDGRVVGSLAAA